MTEKDLYTIFLKRREAYLLFLAKGASDTTLLPAPLTEEDKMLYDYCTTAAAAIAEAAAAAADSGGSGGGSEAVGS